MSIDPNPNPRYRPKRPKWRIIELSLVSLLTSAVTFGLPYFMSGEAHRHYTGT